MTRRRKKLLIIAIVLGIIAIPVGYFVFDSYVHFHGVTSLYLYRPMLSRHRANTDVNVIEYFPPAIPSEATATRFFYFAPPGDVDMQLRCGLPPDEVAALVARVAPIAKLKAHDSDGFDPETPTDSFLRPRFRDPENNGYSKLPDSFTIYLIGVGKGDKASNSDWTFDYGIAVDLQQNEVIYWMSGHAS